MMLFLTSTAMMAVSFPSQRWRTSRAGRDVVEGLLFVFLPHFDPLQNIPPDVP